MTQVVGLKSFETLPTDGIVSIHHPLTPAEVYSGQPIFAKVRTVGSSAAEFEVPVFRLSPLGAEIDVSGLSKLSLSIGSEVDLSVEIAKQKCDFYGVTVAQAHQEAGRSLVGIRWCQSDREGISSEEKRQHTRWFCGDHFLPTGVAPNPARFNDFVYFTVRDISRFGMQLSTSLRNKILIPGMTLEASVSFPMIGQVILHLKISNARIRSENGKDYLALGTEFTNDGKEILETVGQYLLQFGPNLSPTDLKNAGFSPRSAQSAVDFSFVKTAEEYKQVLDLRLLAYAQAGKADGEAKPEVMSDIFDSKSRIMVARHQGKMVGSLRLTFHAPDEDCEYDQFVKFPDSFPRRDEVIVLSRICTHPDYRGSDLFYGLMRQCVLAVLQSKRRYILGGCSDQLLPLYRRVGFKSTELRYEHATLKGVKEQIIVADVSGILSGADTTLSVWNELYADLTGYIDTVSENAFDAAMNARIMIYKSFAPITRLFTRGVRNPKKKV